MKTLLITVSLLVTISVYSQKGEVWHFPKTKGMSFCQAGSFNQERIINRDTVNKTISVQAFWISNEITNKEFREFYNSVKSNPLDTIFRFDLKTKQIIKKSNADIFSEIKDDLINNPKLNNENYFFNKKYDDYPVVGVTNTGAQYYCIWFTNKVNTKNKKKKIIVNFRLPTETEWEYASNFSDGKFKDNRQKINKSKSGKKNKIGIYNMEGNVSEWTMTSEIVDNKEVYIIRGGSWKGQKGTKLRRKMNSFDSSDDVGFRIVREFLMQKK